MTSEIRDINYYGLRGRALYCPFAETKKNSRKNPAPLRETKPAEILFVSGLHSSLERITGLVELLAGSGNVIAPDWPGGGGMDSLYNLKRNWKKTSRKDLQNQFGDDTFPDIKTFATNRRHRRASFDNLAAYLKWFIEQNYRETFARGQKINVVGMSLGFVLVLRMLQNFPEMRRHFHIVMSFVGFANRADFRMKKRSRWGLVLATWIFEHRPLAWLMRVVWCNRPVLKLVYGHTNNQKFANVDFAKTLDMEVKLWRENDVQTYCRMVWEMFLLHDSRKVDLPVYHVAMADDRYFNNDQVQKSLSRIFREVHIIWSQAENHAPSVVATVREARNFMPDEVLGILGRK